jgi:hypothetical protein
MLLKLFVALSMVTLTFVLHIGGLSGLLAVMAAQDRRSPVARGHLSRVVLVLVIVHVLFLLHLLSVLAYAVLYVVVGALPNFEDAFRLSAGVYASVGSDLLVAPAWRLVPAIEAANGVFLLGWSTAFFVSILATIRLIADDFLRR